MKDNLEKTTLGDISELAALKSELEENQKKGNKKPISLKDMGFLLPFLCQSITLNIMSRL